MGPRHSVPLQSRIPESRGQHGPATEGAGLKTETLLASLVRSVDAATTHGIQFGRLTLEKGWELIIVLPRNGVGNPVLKHARRLG